jgi:CRP-like cAMP-binding protein
MRLKGLDLDRDVVDVELGMTQAEIALLLGASRPKVNVALGALESRGAISRTGERLACRPVALAEIAGTDEV